MLEDGTFYDSLHDSGRDTTAHPRHEGRPESLRRSEVIVTQIAIPFAAHETQSGDGDTRDGMKQVHDRVREVDFSFRRTSNRHGYSASRQFSLHAV